MDDFLHRLAVTVLVICGLLSIAVIAWDPLAATEGGWLTALIQHRDFLLALLGVGLVAAALVPTLRPALMTGSILAKLAYLGLALANVSHPGEVATAAWLEAGMLAALLTAAAEFLREARQEARWDGVPRLRADA